MSFLARLYKGLGGRSISGVRAESRQMSSSFARLESRVCGLGAVLRRLNHGVWLEEIWPYVFKFGEWDRF